MIQRIKSQPRILCMQAKIRVIPSSSSEVCIDWFTVEDLIGKGEYSQVFRAMDKLTKRYWAVKKISKAFCLHRNCVPNIKREIKMMSHLYHE